MSDDEAAKPAAETAAPEATATAPATSEANVGEEAETTPRRRRGREEEGTAELRTVVYRGPADVIAIGAQRFHRDRPAEIPPESVEELLTFPRHTFEEVKEQLDDGD